MKIINNINNLFIVVFSKKFLIPIALFFFTPLRAYSQSIHEVYKNAASIQFGLNGATGDKGSYGLQIVSDLSYAREIFEHGKFNISAGIFFDNIWVKTDDKNFTWRVGPRFDFGYTLTTSTAIYATTGIGAMRYKIDSNNHTKLSGVYGAGIVRHVSEFNIQPVSFRQDKTYNIINLSAGLIYGF